MVMVCSSASEYHINITTEECVFCHSLLSTTAGELAPMYHPLMAHTHYRWTPWRMTSQKWKARQRKHPGWFSRDNGAHSSTITQSSERYKKMKLICVWELQQLQRVWFVVHAAAPGSKSWWHHRLEMLALLGCVHKSFSENERKGTFPQMLQNE